MRHSGQKSNKIPPIMWGERWVVSAPLGEINPTPSAAAPALEHMPHRSKSTIPPTPYFHLVNILPRTCNHPLMP